MDKSEADVETAYTATLARWEERVKTKPDLATLSQSEITARQVESMYSLFNRRQWRCSLHLTQYSAVPAKHVRWFCHSHEGLRAHDNEGDDGISSYT